MAKNPEILRNIRLLRARGRSEKAPIWKALASHLVKPKRARAVVNVGEIDRYTNKGDTVVVPGRVLGLGFLSHPVTVSALQFSSTARVKIMEAKGKCISIEELVELNPKGSGVKIMK